MQARLALIAAVVCAALAVAAVATDLAYTLTVSIETQDQDGEWVTVQTVPQEPARTYYEGPGFGSCAGPEVRVVVDNDRPIGASRDVRIWYEYGSGRSTTVFDEALSLDAGERETYAFTIPQSAFAEENTTTERPPFGPEVYINVRVDGLSLFHCAVREAPSGTASKEVRT